MDKYECEYLLLSKQVLIHLIFYAMVSLHMDRQDDYVHAVSKVLNELKSQHSH